MKASEHNTAKLPVKTKQTFHTRRRNLFVDVRKDALSKYKIETIQASLGKHKKRVSS